MSEIPLHNLWSCTGVSVALSPDKRICIALSGDRMTKIGMQGLLEFKARLLITFGVRALQNQGLRKAVNVLSLNCVHGYLAYKQPPPRRTLQ
jgi:hypothetical protein